MSLQSPGGVRVERGVYTLTLALFLSLSHTQTLNSLASVRGSRLAWSVHTHTDSLSLSLSHRNTQLSRVCAGFAFRIECLGIHGFGFRVSGFWFKVSGLVCRVYCFGIVVLGFEFRVESLDFKVLG